MHVAIRRRLPVGLPLSLSVLSLAIVTTLSGCPRLSGPGSGDALRVNRVVLYQNGIGYFERRGKVDGDHVSLRIRPEQIADILKSLTVVDLANGRAVNVALPVEKTRSRRLSDLPPQVREGGGMLAIARAFRGATATVKTGSGSATGRIVGVEPAESGGPRLTVLGDDGTLRAFAVSDVSSLKVRDRTLEVGLRRALDVALNQGSWKPVELTVHLSGPHSHDLLVSYVVEMPTWKPAYRIVLEKDAKQALLQGWAVVDNVSGEDWDKVQLALTAGTPLTFSYDLYSPRYVRRPDLSPPQEEMAVAPPPPTDGVAADEDMEAEKAEQAPSASPSRLYKKSRPTRSRRSGRGAGGLGGLGRKGDYAPPPSPKPMAPREDRARLTSERLQNSFRTLVGTSRVGSLFRYDIQEPVTIRDRQSALVSILNERVPGKDVLLFRIDTSREHPYRAVQLTNATGSVLERGPVAIYRDGAFVGEAVSGRVEAKTAAFIPYALDGRIVITLEDRVNDEGARLLKINRGLITCEMKKVARFKYTIRNRSGEGATLYVQRRHRTGWKLLAPTQGAMFEKEHYFVPIAVAAKGKTLFEVKEEQPVRRTVGISSYDGRRALALYLKGASDDTPVHRQLREVFKLQQQVAQLDSELARLQRAKRAFGERQDEVRENIRLLSKTKGNADLKRKLVANLAELERKLSGVTRELVRRDIERGQLNDRMAVLFKTITLEV